MSFEKLNIKLNKNGVLEADCLICQLKGYNSKTQALAVREWRSKPG